MTIFWLVTAALCGALAGFLFGITRDWRLYRIDTPDGVTGLETRTIK